MRDEPRSPHAFMLTPHGAKELPPFSMQHSTRFARLTTPDQQPTALKVQAVFGSWHAIGQTWVPQTKHSNQSQRPNAGGIHSPVSSCPPDAAGFPVARPS